MLYLEVPIWYAVESLPAGAHLLLMQMEDGVFLRDDRDLVGNVLLGKVIYSTEVVDEGRIFTEYHDYNHLVVVLNEAEEMIMGRYVTVGDFIDSLSAMNRLDQDVTNQAAEMEFRREVLAKEERDFWRSWILYAVIIGAAIVAGVYIVYWLHIRGYLPLLWG